MADFSSDIFRIVTTIRDDIRTSQVGTTFRKESKEIGDFYLSEEQRAQLDRMNKAQRIFHYSSWVLGAMFYKLTPFRRLLFILGVIMLLSVHSSGNVNGSVLLGALLLVLVILLELKDKLLAHDELDEGRRIQDLLKPEATPQVDGWSLFLYTRSANEVCGDLVDFLRLTKPYTAVAIADVAGKGLHAALLTAKLQATMRALAFDEPSMVSLMGRINTIFHRDSPSRMFASLIYAAISENDGSVRFVNAGHLPPFAIRNGVVEEMEKGDLAVGLTGIVHYTEHAVQLNSGDVFVMYSDGVTEAKNDAGAFFGKERLTEILKRAEGPSEQIGRTIVAAVDRFIGQTPPSDDLSLLILRRT